MTAATTVCPSCRLDMASAAGCLPLAFVTDVGIVPRERSDHPGRCHDCGAPVDTYHHPGCAVDQCPHGQSLLCSCQMIGADLPREMQGRRDA